MLTNPSAPKPQRTRALWPILFISLLCISCSSHQVHDAELNNEDSQLQVRLEEVIHQVRLALATTQAYYLEQSQAQSNPLVLTNAQLTLSLSHMNTAEGGFTLFIPVTDTKEDYSASTQLKLTLVGPELSGDSDQQLKTLLASAEQEEIQQALNQLRQESRQSCQSPQQTAAHSDEKALWESIAHIAIAGLDAYLRSVQAHPQLALALHEFEMTIAIGAQSDDSEGATISLGAWTIGDENTQESIQTSTVVLHFQRPDNSAAKKQTDDKKASN